MNNRITIRIKELDLELLKELSEIENTKMSSLIRELILKELKNKGMK